MKGIPAGKAVLVGIRPRDLSVAVPAQELPPGTFFNAIVEKSKSIGPNVWVTGLVCEDRMVAASDGILLAPGERVKLQVKAMHIFDPQTECSVRKPSEQEVEQ